MVRFIMAKANDVGIVNDSYMVANLMHSGKKGVD